MTIVLFPKPICLLCRASIEGLASRNLDGEPMHPMSEWDECDKRATENLRLAMNQALGKWIDNDEWSRKVPS